ncbi:Plant UBX domain-containing protein 5 [Citrus sinensis]|uniref:SEP domain-containing protein n=2 Tax=Citrus TaxID=2706 RepID=V4U9P3_CITCL|nr:hypothetical protein CICLE_v10015438mg [Citrus x clementina]KAH9744908.1 Plant UBX domain-containing protein 5 [Citrus sinensis]
MEKPTAEANSSLINSFVEITSSTKDEALFFLESHQWNLDAAVSTFLDNAAAATASPEASQSVATLPAVNSPSLSNSPSTSPSASLSRSPSRSRSPSPAAARDPYELRSRSRPGKKEDKKAATGTSRGGIRTLADLNRTPPGGADSDDDDDEPQQYYTGGEKSGMLVQDPTKGNQVDEIFNQARQSAVERPDLRASSSSKAFTGTARLLSGETVSSAPAPPPENVSHNITFWRNGFTVDDGPLRGMDDPANASFLEVVFDNNISLTFMILLSLSL